MAKDPRRLVAPGFAIIGAGLAISLAGLLPLFTPDMRVLLMFFGAFVYLPGGFMVAFGARGPEKQRTLRLLRISRLSFLLIIGLGIFLLINSAPSAVDQVSNLMQTVSIFRA